MALILFDKPSKRADAGHADRRASRPPGGPIASRSAASSSLARGITFQSLFILWSIAIFAFLSPSLLWFRSSTYIAKKWSRGSLRVLSCVARIHSCVEGFEHIPKTPCIIAAQHQSTWDTLIFQCILAKYPIYIVKNELFRIPFFGWYMHRCGMIGVDRSGGRRSLMTMITKARARLAAKKHDTIVIFPQGSRVVPGEKAPIHSGLAALYRFTDLPVVPAVVNSGLFWPRRSLRMKKGRAVLRFMPPIQSGLDRKTMIARLEKQWNDAGSDLLRRASYGGKAG